METREPEKQAPRRLFRWALWWGLGIVVACLVVLLTASVAGDGESEDISGPFMDGLYSLIYQFGVWPIMVYMGVVGPVVEEVSFRLWGVGKRTTGYVATILMTLFALSVSPWMALVALAAGVLVATLVKEREKYLFGMMMLSSVMFALTHLGNYSGDWMMTAVALLHKLGMGLVASYLVVNHNLLWSMGFHILNNTILALPLGLAFVNLQHEGTTVETDNFTMTVKPVLTKNSPLLATPLPDKLEGDTITLCGSPSMIASQFYHASYTGRGNMCEWTERPHGRMWMQLVFKTGEHDYAAAYQTMLDQGWVTVDVYEIREDTIFYLSNSYNSLAEL